MKEIIHNIAAVAWAVAGLLLIVFDADIGLVEAAPVFTVSLLHGVIGTLEERR